MVSSALTSARPARPTCIRRIRIERLFGYLTYVLPPEDRSSVDFNRLMILYGDNGSGKTTILTLLFCLLSPVRERGEKTYIARTPFKRFEIEFDDGTTVAATKETDRLVGSYTVTVDQSGADAETFYLKANAENAIMAPSTHTISFRCSHGSPISWG